jgi:hypothetical protein
MWSSENDYFSYILFALLDDIDRLAIVKVPMITRKSVTVQKSFKVPRGSRPRLCCSFCTRLRKFQRVWTGETDVVRTSFTESRVKKHVLENNHL